MYRIDYVSFEKRQGRTLWRAGRQRIVYRVHVYQNLWRATAAGLVLRENSFEFSIPRRENAEGLRPFENAKKNPIVAGKTAGRTRAARFSTARKPNRTIRRGDRRFFLAVPTRGGTRAVYTRRRRDVKKKRRKKTRTNRAHDIRAVRDRNDVEKERKKIKKKNYT